MKYLDKTFFKFLLAFLAILAFALGVIAFTEDLHAQVINEIYYSPSTKQWIEIYNNTDSSIDLTQYKILDAGAAVNGHAITSVSGGSIPAHDYGVIVISSNTSVVNSNYLYKASLGIKTTGDTVTLKKSSSAIDTTTFSDGSATGGNSYQKFDTGWQSNTPTPGAINVAPSSSGSGSTSTTTDSGASTTTDSTSSGVSGATSNPSSHYSFIPLSNVEDQKLTAGVGRDRLGFLGIPLEFKAQLNTADPNTSYFWSFGDGSSAEGRDAFHTYLFAGEYVVVLNAKLFDHEAVSRANIKIVEPNVKVTESGYDHISITNDSKYEINLYKWSLYGDNKVFEFPKDTIVKAGSTIVLPSSITGIRGPAILSTTTNQSIVTFASRDLPQAREDKAIAIVEAAKKLEDIKAELALLPPDSPVPTFTASAIGSELISATTSQSTSTVPENRAKSPWFTTLKRFFFGH